MKLTNKQGKLVEVTVDSKQQMATLDGKKLAFVRDNKVKVLNDMLLTEQSMNVVKEELNKFIKKSDVSKGKRK